MKTCLYAPLYLDGLDAVGNDRLERNIRYLKYYHELKKELGTDTFWFSDNSSSTDNLYQFITATPIDVQIHFFQEHLIKMDKPTSYPYCWRALWFVRDLIQKGFQKIILIDTDAFIVSQRLTHYIRGLETGWTTFWSPKYSFPTAEVQILCQDTFPLFMKFTEKSWERMDGILMETALPFTRVSHDFNCDRWGEEKIEQDVWMDGYFQASLDIPLLFQRNR